MDDLDRRLIALLRDDARSSIASLAKKLRVSRGTVQNRLTAWSGRASSSATRSDSDRRPIRREFVP